MRIHSITPKISTPAAKRKTVNLYSIFITKTVNKSSSKKKKEILLILHAAARNYLCDEDLDEKHSSFSSK